MAVVVASGHVSDATVESTRRLLTAKQADTAYAYFSSKKHLIAEVLRLRIGPDIGDSLAAALEPGIDQEVVDSLEMLYSGAFVRAGMGYVPYADIAARLEKSARGRLRVLARAERA